MNKNEIIKALAGELKGIGKGVITPKLGIGLCAHIGRFMDRLDPDYTMPRTPIIGLMSLWPKASDVKGYPVPHPTLDPLQAYIERHKRQPPRKPGYYYTGEYGANRRELALWLSEELFKLVEEAEKRDVL